MAKASKNDKKATPITPDPVLPTGAEAEQTQPQPKLYPEIHYLIDKNAPDLAKKVNGWIKDTDVEIKNIRTIWVGTKFVCELIYVAVPKPAPRPVKKEKDGKRADKV